MKKTTRLGRPPKVVPPEAESPHNLHVAIRDLANIVKGIDDRTKRLDERTQRLEDAVVPPSLGSRIKTGLGL